jgi:uncharacterized membrane protein YvbJ
MTYCAECGAEITEHKQVCQKCGNIVFTRENITQNIVKSKEKTLLFIGVVTIILGIIIVTLILHKNACINQFWV